VVADGAGRGGRWWPTRDRPGKLLKAMTDYVGSQQSISFEYDANLEVKAHGRTGKRLRWSLSGTVSLARPGQAFATRSGGSSTLRPFSTERRRCWPQQERSHAGRDTGSIDHPIDELQHSTTGRFLLADLLLTDAYEGLMAAVVDVKDLGSGVIGGTSATTSPSDRGSRRAFDRRSARPIPAGTSSRPSA
jgi:hypothetical protein